MTEYVNNFLKQCRDYAGYTQESAAPLLHIAVRTLSDYENDKYPVPLDVIERMVEVYKTPLIARWYVKYRTILGKYMPDIYEIRNEGDMFLQSVIAQEGLKIVVDGIKELLKDDGRIDGNEIESLQLHVQQCKAAIANATSVVCFAEQLIISVA